MYLLAFKLILTPILIAAASFAGRRWGPGVSGWLVALPLVSGPVSFIFAVQYSAPFASHAAIGTMAGMISVSVYCYAYSRLAPRRSWAVCVLAAAFSFFVVTSILNLLTLSLIPTFVAAVLALALARYLIPEPAMVIAAVTPPRWDIPARMITVALFITLLTFAADQLGPQLSGLLSPFPILVTILAVFAHIQYGSSASIHVLRGMLTGLYAFTAFFLIIGSLLTTLPLGITYLVAVITALAVNAFLLRFVRQPPSTEVAEI